MIEALKTRDYSKKVPQRDLSKKKSFHDITRRDFTAPNEPSVDYDYEAVEDPEERCIEELEAICDARNLDVDVTRDMAQMALAWRATQGTSWGASLLERAGDWIAGSKEMNGIHMRAAVFIHLFSRASKQALSLKAIGHIFGCSDSMVHKLSTNLRHSLFGSRNDGWCSRKKGQ